MLNTILSVISNSAENSKLKLCRREKKLPLLLCRESYLQAIVVSFCLTLALAEVEMGFKSLGSLCDRSEECNRNLWLECHQGKCNCTQPSVTIYEEKMSRCVGKVGSSCFHFGVGPHCEENSICNLVTHPPFGTPTTKKSRGQYHGICQSRTSKYGDPCGNSTKKCAEGMACLQGKCDCNPQNRQYYDPLRKRCIISPGGSCNAISWEAQCDHNSICLPHNQDKTSYSCKCNQDSVLNSLNQCKIGYLGRFCNSPNRPCNPEQFLSCVDGACICENPLHRKYSLTVQKCVTLGGSNCSRPIGKVDMPRNETKVLNESRIPPCTENAECLQDKCQCSGNYFETPDRTCQLDIPFGSACEDGQCNQYKGMICRQGICTCFDTDIFYDIKQKACLSPLGSICGKVVINGFNNNQEIWIGCRKPATCAQTTSGSYKCVS